MLPGGSRPRPCNRRCARRGFALVIVLWVLAGLTVVAVAVASSARVSSESTRLLRDRVGAEAAFISTAARIQMIVATSNAGPNHFSGLRGRLYLDGRATEVSADERVALQDGRGLVDLNLVGNQVLTRLLVRCGADEDRTADLVDTLADYVDSDDLKRLNGAEAFDYRLSGDLPPPRNAPLLSRGEVWRIKGWAGVRQAWDAQGCGNDVIVHGDGRFNQNTATLAVLLASGMDEPIARGYLEVRGDGLTTSAGLQPKAEAGADALGILRLAGGAVGPTLRIRHSMALVEWTLEYDLELTPSRPGGPWRLHEVRYGSRQPEAKPSKLTSNFPAVDYRPTEQEQAQGNAPPRLPFGN